MLWIESIPKVAKPEASYILTTPRFVGYVQSGNKGRPAVIKVQTMPQCKDVCLLSDLTMMAGLYDVQGKVGVYYEILIHRMDGIIAIGMPVHLLHNS
jgi:Ran-binding protein 9/10